LASSDPYSTDSKGIVVVVLDIVLWIMALVVGFLLHYLLPHLRKLLLF
jgi:hypothetical protein